MVVLTPCKWQMQVPEMARRELTGALLQLKALGVDSLAEFDFLSPPPPELAAKAVEALHVLGALDAEARCAMAVTLFITHSDNAAGSCKGWKDVYSMRMSDCNTAKAPQHAAWQRWRTGRLTSPVGGQACCAAAGAPGL